MRTPTWLVILNLLDDSMGNASGIGAFDFTTQRLFQKIGFQVTAINAIAGNASVAGKVPLPLENDHKAIEVALQNAGFPAVEGVRDIKEGRLIVIKNNDNS